MEPGNVCLARRANLDEQRVLVAELVFVSLKLGQIDLPRNAAGGFLKFNHQVAFSSSPAVDDDIREHRLSLSLSLIIFIIRIKPMRPYPRVRQAQGVPPRDIFTPLCRVPRKGVYPEPETMRTLSPKPEISGRSGS